MITGIFWWGVLAVLVFVLICLTRKECKRPKYSKIIKNVNQHLYGHLMPNRREHEE